MSALSEDDGYTGGYAGCAYHADDDDDDTANGYNGGDVDGLFSSKPAVQIDFSKAKASGYMTDRAAKDKVRHYTTSYMIAVDYLGKTYYPVKFSLSTEDSKSRVLSEALDVTPTAGYMKKHNEIDWALVQNADFVAEHIVGPLLVPVLIDIGIKHAAHKRPNVPVRIQVKFDGSNLTGSVWSKALTRAGFQRQGVLNFPFYTFYKDMGPPLGGWKK